MAEFKPIEHEVANMIRDFNSGTSKHKTATTLAAELIRTVEKNVFHRVSLGMLSVPNEDANTAMRMIRDAVEQCFGIWASLDSQEAVIGTRGPRHVDEAAAICEGLSRAALDLYAALPLNKASNDDNEN